MKIRLDQHSIELQYLIKGSKQNSNNSTLNNNSLSSNDNYNFNLNYVGVPILFSLKIHEKIKLELGNAINILIKQKKKLIFMK